jgi:hypothetical protein
MLCKGIPLQPYTVIPTLLGSEFGDLGHMSSRNDAITSWLRPNTSSNHFPHPYKTYTKFLSTLICCFKAYSCSLIQLYPSYLAQILGFWVTFRGERMPLRHDSGWEPPQTSPPIHISIYKVYEHIDMLFQGIQLQPYTVIPILLGSEFGVLGHISSRNDAITWWLRLKATSNLSPHPY